MPNTAMEATPEILELLLAVLFAATLVFGICASAVLRRKCIAGEDEEKPAEEKSNEQPKCLGGFREKILESLREGRSKKISESSEPASGQGVLPLLASPLRGGGGDGGERKLSELRVSTSSPVWQRRILMGERCEFPRFSGLILYDENGLPLGSSTLPDARYSVSKDEPEKEAATTAMISKATKTTTLRDLL